MAAQGLAVHLACRVLAVSESGYYARRSRAPSARSIRHAWLSDMIREVHVTSRGTYGIRRVYCAVVLDVWSRRVVGWSIDATPSTALVTNALGMAIEQRRPPGQTIIRSDHGTQFTSWGFTRRAVDSGWPDRTSAAQGRTTPFTSSALTTPSI